MANTHCFSVVAAQELGVAAATMLHHLCFWCEKNASDGINFKDGRYWTYCSYKGLAELFPYFSAKQIRTLLAKLEKDGCIVSGVYNKKSYDKTKWYSVTEKGFSLERASYLSESLLESLSAQPRMEDESLCPNGQTLCPNGQSLCPNGQTNTRYSIKIKAEDNTSTLSSSANSEAIAEIVSYLNEILGTRYKPTTASTRKLINARLNEGFTVDDFKAVIDAKYAQWGNDPKMAEYLRPSTLFGTKFEGYLNSSMARRAPHTTVDLSIYDRGVTEWVPIEEDTSWSS